MKVEFYTNTYERSHGVKPKGRGGWAFIIMDGNREHDTVFVPGSMTLADAKKWMREHCKGREELQGLAFVEVEVAP